MRLSSRKKLIQESDLVLIEIRKKILQERLVKESQVFNFLDNLIKSITHIIVMAYKTNRQTYYYKKMPYLMGIDLINNKNLKIEKKYLERLDSLIESIIMDLKNSPELDSALKELQTAESKIRIARMYVQHSYGIKNKNPTEFETLMNELKKKIEQYNKVLLNKVSVIIKNILKMEKYKDFEQTVISNLKKGLAGISNKELNIVKINYLDELSKRASEYVDKEKVIHTLTWAEELQRQQSWAQNS